MTTKKTERFDVELLKVKLISRLVFRCRKCGRDIKITKLRKVPYSHEEYNHRNYFV